MKNFQNYFYFLQKKSFFCDGISKIVDWYYCAALLPLWSTVLLLALLCHRFDCPFIWIKLRCHKSFVIWLAIMPVAKQFFLNVIRIKMIISNVIFDEGWWWYWWWRKQEKRRRWIALSLSNCSVVLIKQRCH